MTESTTPTTTRLTQDFSDPGAQPTPWHEAVEVINSARVFFFTTVREDGRPHQTPLIAVWLDKALYFCTGPDEQKGRNLQKNPHVLLTCGDSDYEGLDVVVEGEARRVTDNAHLQRLADAWLAKYGPEWKFDVGNGTFVAAEHGEPWVYEVAPRKAIGFRKSPFAQTTWRF